MPTCKLPRKQGVQEREGSEGERGMAAMFENWRTLRQLSSQGRTLESQERHHWRPTRPICFSHEKSVGGRVGKERRKN